jgi:hypothetical protein
MYMLHLQNVYTISHKLTEYLGKTTVSLKEKGRTNQLAESLTLSFFSSAGCPCDEAGLYSEE